MLVGACHVLQNYEIIGERVKVFFHLCERQVNELLVCAVWVEVYHVESKKGRQLPSPFLYILTKENRIKNQPLKSSWYRLGLRMEQV